MPSKSIVAALLLLPATQAAAAPQQLLNRTVFVSTTITANAKAEDGTLTTMPRTIQRVIYVSSKGRVFARVARQAGRNYTSTDVDPGSGNIRFDGSKLIGVVKFPSGAGQMVVSFDPGFTSCTTSIIMGRDSGRPIQFKGLNGKMYTQQGAFNVSNSSCSVREGNALAE